MQMPDPEITRCRTIRSQIVGDHRLRREAKFLQQLAHQFERGGPIAPGLDENIQDFAFRVDGAPEIDETSINLEIDLVQMPDRVWLGSTFAQVRRNHRTEMVPPSPDRLVGDSNAALRQQILDVAEAQREPEIEPDRLLDDLGRKPVAGVADFGHGRE